jgi:hypothetical protein
MDLTIISRMADAGFVFAPTTMGMTRSDRQGWPELATNGKTMLRQWVKEGNSLVSVARRGHGSMLDIDDPAAIKARGFDFGWLEGYYVVDSASGHGIHAYGLHDAESQALPNKIDVLAEKGNRNSGPILEYKGHNSSCAAPTAIRLERVCGKPDGEYLPRSPFTGTKAGLPARLIAWLNEHGEQAKPAPTGCKVPFEFHPEFDLDEFLENEGCTEANSGWVGGSFHAEVETCPHCGVEARQSTLAAAVAKFIFGGNSYGFMCHACGLDSREKHETGMAEEDPDYQPWSKPIYRHDDVELLFLDGERVGLKVTVVGQERDRAAYGRNDVSGPSSAEREGEPPAPEAPEFSDDEIRKEIHNAIYSTDEDGREHAKPEREIRLGATRILHAALQSRDRGLLVDGNARFMYHEPKTDRLMDLDGREFRNCLFDWGLPESQTTDAIIEGLKNKTISMTGPVDIYPVWHYDPGKHTLYANIEDKSLCVVTREEWGVKPNGHDGVWMHSLTGGLPKACLEHIAPWEGSGLELRNTALCNLVRMKYEVEEGIAQEDMEWLFRARLLVGCLPEMAEYRNLCAAISNRHSSGKTTLFSYPGWLFEGEDFYPTALTGKKDSDQLETVMTQKAILLADNVDRASEMAQHILCMAATTGKVSKRAHYKNFELAEARFRADVYMTALQLPKSLKGNVYSRLLMFRLAVQEQDGLTETQRKRRFLGKRAEMLGEIISRLQAMIRDEAAIEQSGKGHTYRTEFRIKDFGLFLLRQAGLYGQEQHAARLLEALTDQQRESCVEASAIEPPLDYMVGVLNYRGKRFGHSELYREMASVHRIHVDPGGKFYFADAKGLKSYLMPNQELLRKRWGLIWDRTGRNRYWYFKPTQQQIEDAQARLGPACEAGAEHA